MLNGAGYRTIVPYLRGYHPDTIVPGRGYTGQEIGDDAIRLLDALGLDSAVLVGHDWGSAVVFGAAAQAPERVRALVLGGDPPSTQDQPLAGRSCGGRATSSRCACRAGPGSRAARTSAISTC